MVNFIAYNGHLYYVEAHSSHGRWKLRGEGKSWAEALKDLAAKLEKVESDPRKESFSVPGIGCEATTLEELIVEAKEVMDENIYEDTEE